jgi:hypothetical protein
LFPAYRGRGACCMSLSQSMPVLLQSSSVSCRPRNLYWSPVECQSSFRKPSTAWSGPHVDIDIIKPCSHRRGSTRAAEVTHNGVSCVSTTLRASMPFAVDGTFEIGFRSSTKPAGVSLQLNVLRTFCRAQFGCSRNRHPISNPYSRTTDWYRQYRASTCPVSAFRPLARRSCSVFFSHPIKSISS